MIAALTLAAVTVLPSGTYHYAVYADGKVAAESVVKIARQSNVVNVYERVANVIGLSGSVSLVRDSAPPTARSLDPTTFSTRSWSQKSDDDTVTIAVTKAGATWDSRFQGTYNKHAPSAGPAVVFDSSMGALAIVPAMVHATGVLSYAEYCVCPKGFDAKTVTVVPATQARPAHALATDRAIAVKDGDETTTLWYDPQTFVVHEADLAKERIACVLVKTT